MNTYDDANNLIFNIGDKEFRVFNCNWRVQRKIISLMLAVQHQGNSLMFGSDDVLDKNDALLAMFQLKVDESWVTLNKQNADMNISNLSEYTMLFEKIAECTESFLAEGEQNSPPKSEAKTTNKINRPSNT